MEYISKKVAAYGQFVLVFVKSVVVKCFMIQSYIGPGVHNCMRNLFCSNPKPFSSTLSLHLSCNLLFLLSPFHASKLYYPLSLPFPLKFNFLISPSFLLFFSFIIYFTFLSSLHLLSSSHPPFLFSSSFCPLFFSRLPFIFISSFLFIPFFS